MLALAETKDFVDFGFEPEFIGRLPVRVAANSKGDVFVLDGKLRRIGRISKGAFAGWVDVPADGNVVPRSLRVDGSDNLWVLDVGAGRLIVVDPDGNPLLFDQHR